MSLKRKKQQRPKKILGVIGGMGPLATVYFFEKIVKLTPAREDKQHIRIIIDSNPQIPDRTKAIIGKGESPIEELIRIAKMLKVYGANLIAIPCVSAHTFYEEIQEKVEIPILNIVDEGLKYIKVKFPWIKKAGLLATTGTIKSKIFEKNMNRENIDIVIPDEKQQAIVMKVIYKIKEGNFNDLHKNMVLEICSKLIRNGSEAIIAGCSEIPLLLKKEDIEVPLIDLVEILAKTIVDIAIGKKERAKNECVKI